MSEISKKNFKLEIFDHLNHGRIVKTINGDQSFLLDILPDILEQFLEHNEIVINIVNIK